MEKKSYNVILKELRESKGLSRVSVAKSVGVTKSAIAMYERGERVPKDDTKKKFSKLFGTSVEYIFYR